MHHFRKLEFPCRRHLNVRKVFEEFIDQLSQVNGLSSKKVFVTNYNEWAQNCNFCFRSLKQTKNKWSEICHSFERFARVRTLLCTVWCLAGLWEGYWIFSLLSLIFHTFVECVIFVLNKKVVAGTLVKSSLKCTFLTLSQMKTSLTRMEELSISSDTFQNTWQDKFVSCFVRKSSYLVTQNVVPWLNKLYFMDSLINYALWAIIVTFIAVCPLQIIINKDLSKHFYPLVFLMNGLTVASYGYFARAFLKHSFVLCHDLSTQNYIFMKWFKSWSKCNNIVIGFCHYKFTLLNFMHCEDSECSLDDSQCAFLTVWFLMSLERLLKVALRNGNSEGAVKKLFSNTLVDDEKSLDIQYIIRRLQNVLEASLKPSFKTKNVTANRRNYHFRDNESSVSEDGLTPQPPNSTSFNDVNNCGESSTGSAFSRCFINPKSSSFSSHSDSSTRSFCSLPYVSNYLQENRKSENVKAFPKISTPKTFSSSHSLVSSNYARHSASASDSVNDFRKISLSKNGSNPSSEYVASRIQEHSSSNTPASQSSLSSEEQQLYKNGSSAKESNGLCLPGQSNSRAQPTETSTVSCPSGGVNSSSETLLMLKTKELHQTKFPQNSSRNITSSETSVKSRSEKMPQAEKHFSQENLSSKITHSETASSAKGSDCLPKKNFFATPQDSNVRAECVLHNHIDKQNKEISYREIQNPPESVIRKNTSQDKFALSQVTVQEIQTDNPQTENCNINSFTTLRAKLVSPSRSSNFDGVCNEKHESNSCAGEEFLQCDHNCSLSTTAPLSDGHKNMPETLSANGPGANYKNTTHPLKKMENSFVRGNDSCEESTKSSYLSSDENPSSSDSLDSMDYPQAFRHKAGIIRTSSSAVSERKMAPRPPSECSSVSLPSKFFASDLSFPMASSEDKNFRFHAESGCTSDTPYTEQASSFDSPRVTWKTSGKTRDTVHSIDLPKISSGVETENVVGGTKGTFKFDNFDFSFDLRTASKNMTLKFYCDSEGECDESTPTKRREMQHHANPNHWAPEFHCKASDSSETQEGEHINLTKSPSHRSSRCRQHAEKADDCENPYSETYDTHRFPVKNCIDSESDCSNSDYIVLWDENTNPMQRERKRTVEFNADDISCNFKRRRNSGPVKLQYHRRSEARDFLFKSRFKRFRFRCGNSVPRTESFEHQEQQIPYDSNNEPQYSENESFT